MKLLTYLRKEWLSLLLIALPYLVIALLWERIPERVPIHWGADGKADGFAQKGIEAFWIPMINIFILLLFEAIPYLNPKKIKESIKTLRIIKVATIAFMSLVFCIGYLESANISLINTGDASMIGICVLFIIIGNYLTKIKPNYFAGIRTPWTLESEQNWKLTHRIGARTFMLGGLLMLMLSLLIQGETFVYLVFLPGTMLMAAIPIIFSFLYFQKEKRKNYDKSFSED